MTQAQALQELLDKFVSDDAFVHNGVLMVGALQEGGMEHGNAYLAHLKHQGVSILNLRDIDDSERALAETRAAMERGANHITGVCDAA